MCETAWLHDSRSAASTIYVAIGELLRCSLEIVKQPFQVQQLLLLPFSTRQAVRQLLSHDYSSKEHTSGQGLTNGENRQSKIVATSRLATILLLENGCHA